MNVTNLDALVAVVNATHKLPNDFNLTSTMGWLTMLNGTNSFNETLASALNVSVVDLNAAYASIANAANTTVPAAIVSTLKPALNATAPHTPSKADLAKAAAQKAMMDFFKERIFTLQLFLLTGYGIMFLLCVILILYLRFNRNVAFRGDMNAARKVILPAFEPLLIVLAIATGSYVIFFCFALATNLYTYAISKLATEVFYSGRQFVFLSIVVFMLQTSVSGPALRRSVIMTFLLATYTIPIVWYMVTYGNPEHLYTVITVTRSLMLILYTYIFIRPPRRASKRTIREFCVYAYIYYGLLFAYNDLFRQAKLVPGFNLTYANLLWGSLCPLVIWRVLKADTEHWRGMGQRAVALQSLFRQKNNLPERVSSKGLHVLIEMHRKYIIDFAYLELKTRIGMGASAVVFNGILRSKIPVAVKVYAPSDFTEETVAEFSQEAALCGALHHPNIVRFYGMCVCPPTICLVSELCQGSLEDVTCAMARRSHHPNRQQMLINVAYMLDAARAVAYIHSFSPAFLHRDIKPANFLVDSENTVKLTDFGESRSLPRTQVAANKHHIKQQTSFKPGYVESGGRESVQLSSGAGISQVRKSEMNMGGERLTIKGTVDYMAPEIINGKGGQALYGEAADVYSLGITMWDILYPGQEKYPQVNGNQFKIFEAVTDGQRPELLPNLHATLRMVIETAWHADARLRPSAQNIVSILETIQEEVAAIFASELSEELEEEMVMSKLGGTMEQSFTGEHAVDQMEELHYVSAPSEAIRIGNALMDSGLLHHVKHARPFEHSSSMYYFDEDNINLCQPIENGGGGGYGANGKKQLSDDETSSIQTGSTRRSKRTHTNAASSTLYGSQSTHSDQLLLQNGMCSCRKLGQRLTLPKAQSRRRFRKNKYKAIAEESVLQASLLHEEHGTQPDLLRHSHSNDFDDFDTVGSAA